MTAPVTLTFTNATVTLSRVDDLVTAVVSYAAASPSGFQALPVGFQPADGDLTFVNTGDYSAPGTVTMQVSVVVGDAGISLGGYNSPPTSPGSFVARWLADPAPTDDATSPVTLTWTNGQKITLSRVGDVITASVDMSLVTGAIDSTIMNYPSPVFSPAGNVRLFWQDAGGRYSVSIQETGITLALPSGVAPWPNMVATWLGDPLPGGTQWPGDDELAEFYVHSVLVETYLGTNGYGEDTFAPAIAVGGFLDDSRKLVRTSNGEQVISESQFYTRPENGALFSAESRVTVDGVTSRVIRTNVNTSGGLELPDHAVISLT